MTRTLRFTLPATCLLAALTALPASAGLPAYPQVKTFELPPGATRMLVLWFQPGPAFVRIDCDFPENLLVHVCDEAGYVVAFHHGGPCVVNWTCWRPGRFVIVVTNNGPWQMTCRWESNGVEAWTPR